MGLCPSRNRSIATSKALKEPIVSTAPPGLDAPQTDFKLRADADSFVPQPKPPVVKEPWETFLDQKQKEVVSAAKNNNAKNNNAPNFVRKVDGTFTSDYRRLLESEQKPGARRYVPPQQRGNTNAMGKADDIIREWKQTDFTLQTGKVQGTWLRRLAQPGPGTRQVPKKAPEAKQFQSSFEEADAKLRAALVKVRTGGAGLADPTKDLDALQAMDAAQVAKDDSELAQGRLVPFGLTDYHYFSDAPDSAKSHHHVGTVHRKPKEYARNKRITPELEESMTEVLYRLRGLKTAETGVGLDKSRRYCVGIREVGRALKDTQSCSLKAVLVAPDVEQGGRTMKGSLDEKLSALLSNCADLGIPVVYGLSRVRLGQAIKKSVTISVMGIMDVRGMQEPFDKMLTLAT